MNSSELRGYLVGIIIGDGMIDKGTTARGMRIKSINTDFVEKIERDLRRVTNFNMVVKSHEASFRGGVNRRPFDELRVRAHPYFAKIFHQYYDDYRKRRITREEFSRITEAGLANWFMSDGYITKVGLTKGKIVDRRVEISTDAYTKEEVEMMVEVLGEKFSLRATVHKRGKTYRVRFSLYDAPKFLLMIAPHMVPSMFYKLNLAYDYQPNWMDDTYYELMNVLQNVKLLTNDSMKSVEEDDIVYIQSLIEEINSKRKTL